MTSTTTFVTKTATLTVHRPPGTAEAALLIEVVDGAVASITLPDRERRRLAELLTGDEAAVLTPETIISSPIEAGDLG